jgi:RNA polymerase sigma-70 factor (ECF subfamily)
MECLVMDEQQADQLVAEVQAGRKESFRALFLAFERPVRIYLSAHAPTADVVEEVLQATFVACYESIQTYERRGTFLFWLKGIARIRLLKELHERTRHAGLGGDALDGLVAAAAAEQRDDATGEDHAALERCLAGISPTLRTLLKQRYVERRAVKDLAVELGRTETWVSVALHRTRAFLRTCLSRRRLA